MIGARRSIVITGPSRIHTDLGFSAHRAVLGAERLHADLRRPAAASARAPGDLLGRRRVFVAGLSLFLGASLLGGLAQSEAWLLGARALQGHRGRDRRAVDPRAADDHLRRGRRAHRAISMYSSASAAGASIGVLLGGVLTDLLSWRWGPVHQRPHRPRGRGAGPHPPPDTEPQRGHLDLAAPRPRSPA
jgi:hypothetical protein